MLKSFKYRIYPKQHQKELIDKTFGVCRLVYNLALETKIATYQACGVSLSAYGLQRQLKDLQHEYPWMKEVDSQAVRAAINNIDTAYNNFFKGGGFPQFKNKKGRQSFRCPNHKRHVDFEKSTLTVPKIKNIPIVVSRRFEGKIKAVTIIRTPTGKYYASVLVETTDKPREAVRTGAALGVDLGISTFATLSTGEKIASPKFLLRSLKRLSTLQMRASRKKKGSKNRQRANLRVALLCEKITNQRTDFLQKLTTQLIRDNQVDTICVETLTPSNMLKNRRLSRAISDAGWGEFIRMLEYKAKWYGKNLIKVNRFFASSKICSRCGHKVEELPLDIREWNCEKCGVVHDRDVNAAINIRNSGMGNPGGLVESSTIVEAMKQEAESSARQALQ